MSNPFEDLRQAVVVRPMNSPGPQGAAAPEMKVQYSHDGSSWHDDPVDTDRYLRFSTNNGISWSDAVYFNNLVETLEWVEKARQWAENPENNPVEGDQYSALHHALQAKKAEITAGEYAIDAAGSAIEAFGAAAPAWDSETVYNYNDVVSFNNGHTYRCIGTDIVGTNHAPNIDGMDNEAEWTRITVAPDGFFEVDSYGNLMPKVTPLSSDHFILDANGDIMPLSDDGTLGDTHFYDSVYYAYVDTEDGLLHAIDTSIEKNVYIVTPVSITSDLTIPNNITLGFKNNGRLVPADGVTLTINGYIDSEAKYIFGGNEPIHGTPHNDIAYIDWFGGVGDGVTEESAFLNRVFSSFSDKKGIKFIGTAGKKYTYDQHILVTNRKDFLFDGKGIELHDLSKEIECYESWDNETMTGTGSVIRKAPVGFEVNGVSHVEIGNIDMYAYNTYAPAKNWEDVTQHLRIVGTPSSHGEKAVVYGVRMNGHVGPYIPGMTDISVVPVTRMIDVMRSSYLGIGEFKNVEVYDCEIMPDCGDGEIFSFGDCEYIHWHDCRCDHGYSQDDLQSSGLYGTAPGRKSTRTFWSFGKVIKCDIQLIENHYVTSWSPGDFIDVSAKKYITYRNNYIGYPCGSICGFTQEWGSHNITNGDLVIYGNSGVFRRGVTVDTGFVDNYKSSNSITSDGFGVDECRGVKTVIVSNVKRELGKSIHIGPDVYPIKLSSEMCQQKTSLIIENSTFESSYGFNEPGSYIGIFSWKSATIFNNSIFDLHYWDSLQMGKYPGYMFILSRFSHPIYGPTSDFSTLDDNVIFNNCKFKNTKFHLANNVQFNGCIFRNCLFIAYDYDNNTLHQNLVFKNCIFEFDSTIPYGGLSYWILHTTPSASLTKLVISGCEYIGKLKFDPYNNGSVNSALSGKVAYINNNIFDIEILDSNGNPTETYVTAPVSGDFSNFTRVIYNDNI